MPKDNTGPVHALFRSTRDDGTEWLFLVQADNKYAITCNEKLVASGSADRTGIRSGVDQFLLLTGIGKREVAAAQA